MKKAAILLTILLAGCEAVAPATMAGLRSNKSQEAYKACLMANRDKPGACEVERKIYEIDLRGYDAAARADP